MQFIPEFDILLTFTVASIIISATPGPDMTLFLGRTIQHGKSAGQAALLGALSGMVVHTLLVAFGISALLAASQTAFTLLKTVGAGYLLWLAFQTIRNGSTLKLNGKKTKPASFINNWLSGLGINLLNPKIVLFFVTFLPQFVSSNDPEAIGKLLFLGFYFIFIGSWICLAIILTANRFVKVLTGSRRITRILDYSFAAIFSAFAVKILATQKL